MRTSAHRQGPSLSFGTPLVLVLVVVSVVIAAGSWGSAWLPESDDSAWASLRRGLRVEEPRSFPFWWLTVVFLVAALASYAQGAWRARRGSSGAAWAWWTFAAAMTWMSLDHALALHALLPTWTAGVVPGPAGRHPVEALLVLVVGPAAVVAVVTAVSRRQQALLAVAGVTYVLGEVVVGRGVADLGLSEPRRQLLESVLQWAGAILLLAAAGTGTQARRVARR